MEGPGVNASLPERARSLLPVLRRAARDQSQIRGLTHCFYRYPARFSPTFAGAAIEAFSRPGQVVFDPFMGGGTTIVEAMVRGPSINVQNSVRSNRPENA